MIEILVQNTNLFIQSISLNFARSRDNRLTDAIEMRAHSGLLLYARVIKANRLNIE